MSHLLAVAPFLALHSFFPWLVQQWGMRWGNRRVLVPGSEMRWGSHAPQKPGTGSGAVWREASSLSVCTGIKKKAQ